MRFGPSPSDDNQINGRWHKCKKCGRLWSDADGECVTCAEIEEQEAQEYETEEG